MIFGAPRRNSRRRRSFRTVSPSAIVCAGTPESLETRALLTNLSIRDAFLVNGLNSRIEQPVFGQQLQIRAVYHVSGLSSWQSYSVEVSVNGVPVERSGLTFGAGAAPGLWYVDVHHGFAEQGTHVVQVTLDSAHHVAENDEADNALSFEFRSRRAAAFPQKLRFPVPGSAGIDWRVSAFADLDGRPGYLRDYLGGEFTYDTEDFGHDAIDIGTGRFSATDRGIPIIAAADGVVSQIGDGAFDRQTAFQDPAPAANFVVIDLGRGWRTKYWHLRRDSVSVRVGDTVHAGDFLGWMGSSGLSGGPHLHFELTITNQPVETMIDPDTYWEVVPDYPASYRHVIDSGFTNRIPTTSEWIEQPQDIRVHKPGTSLFFWVIAGAMLPGDTRTIRFMSPDGSLVVDQTTTQGSVFYATSQWTYRLNLPDDAVHGTWSASWLQNGLELAHQTFEVSTWGIPRLRVESGSEFLLNNRYTPLDAGTVVTNRQSPVRTLMISNQGSAPLTIDDVQLPVGFDLITRPVALVQPGNFTQLQFRLNSTNPGYFSGPLTFRTNDGSVSSYQLWLEGTVTTPGVPVLIPGISVRSADEGSRFRMNIRRTGDRSRSQVVFLTADHDNVVVPSRVTIPAGHSFVNFPVRAVHDFVRDDDQRVVITASAPGARSGRNEVLIKDVFAGSLLVEQTETDTVVSEDGQTDELRLSLSAAPLSPVVIQALMPADAKYTLSRTRWRFTPDNWNVPQVVTLAAVDDHEGEGTQVYDLKFVVVRPHSDPAFHASPPALVAVTVLDNEPEAPEFSTPTAIAAGRDFYAVVEPITGAAEYRIRAVFHSRDTIQAVEYATSKRAILVDGSSEPGIVTVSIRVLFRDGSTTQWSAPSEIGIFRRPVLEPKHHRSENSRPLLSWTSDASASSYEVRMTRESEAGSDETVFAELTESNFSPPQSLLLGHYRFQVRAVDYQGTPSPWSASKRIAVVTRPELSLTPGVTIAPRPLLRWDRVEGAAVYDVELRQVSTGELLQSFSGISDASVQLPGPLTAGNYRWRVRGQTETGFTGLWSLSRLLSMDGRPILTVVRLQPDRSVLLRWKRVQGASFYEVRADRIDTREVGVIQDHPLTETFWQSLELHPAGTWRIWLRALRPNGSGGVSDSGGAWSSVLVES